MKTALSILLVLLRIACFGQDSVVIGVIEKNNFSDQRKYIHQGRTKFSYQTRLRQLFTKDATGWNVVNAFPKKVRFYKSEKANEHKIVTGKLLSKKFEFSDQYDGLYSIPMGNYSLQNIKTKGVDPATAFEHKDILAFRLVTNKINFVSRQYLQQAIISDTEKIALFDTLLIKAKLLISQNINLPLDSVDFVSPRAEVLSKTKKTQFDSIKYLSVQKDSIGNKLIHFKIKSIFYSITGDLFSLSHFREDNVPDPEAFCIIRPNGEVKLFFADMHLLDHGDYDNDGKEEYLFFYSIFNHYGYVMVYDDFNKYVSNTWSYH